MAASSCESSVEDVNYQFFVDFVETLPNSHSLRVLDYGCGRGHIVTSLRHRGVDCYGVDSFTHPRARAALATELFEKGVIRPLENDRRIPFPDAYFDVVISNQVFEHVQDKAAVAQELVRTIKPDGVMRHHFPSREVIREGHIGIPLVHRFPPGRLRWFYAYVLRRVGFGYDWENLAAREWTDTVTNYLDDFCAYERYRDIREIFERHFVITHHELEYIQYRLRARRLLHALVSLRVFKPLYERAFRRLAFMILEMRPHPGARKRI